MQDRFKCRYWSKEKNRYLTTNKLVYNDGTYTQVGSRQSSNGSYYSYIVDEYNTFDIIQEQCTGLKDKNAKLIYEGDILQDSEQKILVKYDVNRHCFMFEYQDTRAYKPICDIDVLSGNFEVIGNIHENADLLENKDE